MSLLDEAAVRGLDGPDDTKVVARQCAKCGVALTGTDEDFALEGWGLLRRRLLCPLCLPKKYRSGL